MSKKLAWLGLFVFFLVSGLAALPAFTLAEDDLLSSDDSLTSDDDLLTSDDELLTDETPQVEKETLKVKAKANTKTAQKNKQHAGLLKADDFPSAKKCATCHQTIYNEWRTSNHAYSAVSPMFHKFELAANALTSGSLGNFCVRCHSSVGTTLGEKRTIALWKRSPVAREGVTCVVCHRVKNEFTKVNGERRIEPGSIFEPVVAPGDGKTLAEVLSKKDFYKVSTNKAERGMRIHNGIIPSETMSKSQFCMSCHQVQVHPGIKLEVVWEQYRASPAASNHVSCQDCHMGKTPGRADGYARISVARMGGTAVKPERKHANHSFWGPGYTIAHPGIFPQHEDADNFEIKDWLSFDYRAKWGSDDFEEAVEDGTIKVEFPEAWEDPDDRADAWQIVSDNLALLEEKKESRKAIMENGSELEGPYFTSKLAVGKTLDFNYIVKNTNPGHNMPSGSLGAQPQLWVNVVLIDPDGKNIWESGYVDSQGDVADMHSTDVQSGKIEFDDQLVNYQTKFLTTNVKGTDREMFLPINFDLDQRPLARPANAPNSVLNHPAFVRMEGHSIPPLGSRKAKYSVPGDKIKKPGKYKLSIRLRSRAEPIAFMSFIGATTDMKRSMNEWMIDAHAYTVEFEVTR